MMINPLVLIGGLVSVFGLVSYGIFSLPPLEGVNPEDCEAGRDVSYWTGLIGLSLFFLCLPPVGDLWLGTILWLAVGLRLRRRFVNRRHWALVDRIAVVFFWFLYLRCSGEA